MADSILNSSFTEDIENEDPLNLTPSGKTSRHRYSSFDTKQFSVYARDSPSQAKRALEAHIADTDRRIEDASKLGTALLEQKKELNERLQDVEREQSNQEIGPDLKKKLMELEKEFNEVGRESARALLPKTRKASVDVDGGRDGAILTADGRQSPTKLHVPSSRKQRNSASGRVHDLEFATEISTSLLGQVRHLQNALAQKEDALRKANHENAQLLSDSEVLHQKIRTMDEDEQRYKDENWNLETQLQDTVAQVKDYAFREQRSSQVLAAVRTEKSTAEREYEDLRQAHNKLADDHESLRRKHDTDVSGLRRQVMNNETERETMQRKITELVSQNQDLAKAVAYRARTEAQEDEQGEASEEYITAADETTPEPSPPPSPNKATPRHGALESETLKSSLQHAHRMIQNLKNNIHREKTDKIELKRLLQDARDELEESKRNGATRSAAGKLKKSTGANDGFKKPAKPGKLGSVQQAREEVLGDPSWEEYDSSPTRPRFQSTKDREDNTESSDAFETATERDYGASESDAFHTGVESIAGDSSDELTETEATHAGSSKRSKLAGTGARSRASFLSTASDDGDAMFDVATPLQHKVSRSRMNLNRGSSVGASGSPGVYDSPASILSNRSIVGGNQSLAFELEGLGDDSASVANSTPTRTIVSAAVTPDVGRGGLTSPEVQSSMTPPTKAPMVDATTLTDFVHTPSKDHSAARASVTPVTDQQRSLGSPIQGLEFSPPQIEETHAAEVEPTHSLVEIPLEMSLISSVDTVPVFPAKASQPRNLVISKGIETIPVLPVIEPSLKQPSSSFDTAEGMSDETAVAPSTIAFTRSIDASAEGENMSSQSAPDLDIFTNSPDIHSSANASRNDIQHLAPEDIVTASAATPAVALNTMLLSNLRAAQAIPSSTSNSLNTSSSFTTYNDNTGGEDLPLIQSSTPTRDAKMRIEQQRSPLTPTSGNAVPLGARTPGPVSTTTTPSTEMKNEGTQTVVSADQIEQMLRDKARRSLVVSTGTAFNTSPGSKSASSGRTMSMGARMTESPPNFSDLLGPRSPKRPGSSSSTRKTTTSPPKKDLPPLPPDHKEVIAAASRNSSMLGNVAPSYLLASGSKTSIRPRTPSGAFEKQQSALRGNRASSIAGRSEYGALPGTRRSSVSSFASELDARFNIAPPYPYAGSDSNFDGTTDPRMIQAITQTMIGEFLWKYTRKTGRINEHSDNRHKRFFWIHPYTRTLYWSSQDPTRAGRSELKAKSVAIEAVRVVTDENPIPPGLHQKSIIVMTPGRSIKFTALTSQRHETWFNALSYLLLRAGSEQYGGHDGQADVSYNYSDTTATLNNTQDRTNTISSLTSEDLYEFNPTLHPRSPSRMTTGSRHSVGSTTKKRASYGTSGRNASPQGRLYENSKALSASERYRSGTKNAVAVRPGQQTSDGIAEASESPSKLAQPQTGTPDTGVFKKPGAPASQRPASYSSQTSRLGSITSKLRPPSLFSGRSVSRSQMRSEDAEQGDSQAGNTNSERPVTKGGETAVGSAQSETAPIENVRACCDGKHDVGSLSRKSSRHVHG